MGEKFTIAIVDDDAAIRRLLNFYMARAGYETVECATGEEARQMLSTSPWDLAILDRRLPDMDGVVLAHELRSKREMRELLARIRAGKRIVELQKELIEANKRLELLSITDGLTRLYNHRYFQDELLRAFEESVRYDRPLSLAIIDIDFFKKVNDTYGHAVGDEVLKSVSKVFRESIRATDLVARYGGEEFAVMMPETELDDAMTFAEKIRSLVESTVAETQAGPLQVTVSIGVSAAPRTKARSAKELVVHADKALYRAKKAGRNRVEAEKRRDVNRVTRPEFDNVPVGTH